MRTKKNPGSDNLLMVAILGVLGYGWYAGWFKGLFSGSAAPASVPVCPAGFSLSLSGACQPTPTVFQASGANINPSSSASSSLPNCLTGADVNAPSFAAQINTLVHANPGIAANDARLVSLLQQGTTAGYSPACTQNLMALIVGLQSAGLIGPQNASAGVVRL